MLDEKRRADWTADCQACRFARHSLPRLKAESSAIRHANRKPGHNVITAYGPPGEQTFSHVWLTAIPEATPEFPF